MIHWCGVVPVSATKRRAKVRGDIGGAPGQVVDGHGGVEVLEHPLQHRAEALGRRRGHRAVDELALPAVAVGRHDHAAGDRRGDRRPELEPHEVEGGVDAGGRARARDDRAVADVEHVGVHPGPRVEEGELLGVRQWVVQSRSSRSPAAPRVKAPEHTDITHAPRSTAVRSSSTTAGDGLPASDEAGTAMRSASAAASRPWAAVTVVPLRASSGPGVSAHTR